MTQRRPSGPPGGQSDGSGIASGWLVMVASILVVVIGQYCWAYGNKKSGVGLAIAGGIGLAVLFWRRARSGLDTRRKKDR
jgi:hypothetical protein